MNRSEFIDIKAFKEKVKHPSVAMKQRWRANLTHDFGLGPIAYVIRIIMQEPFGNKWVVHYHLENGGQIPNGLANTGLLTEEQIKENFEFIITPPVQATPNGWNNTVNVSGTIAYFNPINAVVPPNFIHTT